MHGQDGTDMTEERNAPEDALDAEAALRRWNQAPRVRDPVGLETHVPESAAAAERAELASAIDPAILPGEASDPAHVVVRLEQIEAPTRADDSPELGKHLRPSMEMVEALDAERRVDRARRHLAAQIERGRTDDLDVGEPLGRAPLADDLPEVRDRLDRDHRARSTRDQRREVAASGSELEDPAVAALTC